MKIQKIFFLSLLVLGITSCRTVTNYERIVNTGYKETKEYTRYSRGEKQVDWDTDTTVTTKNIIITFAQNYNLNDGSGKGRQGLDNIGKLEGYYI